jgi:hypothetical protein
LATSRLANYSNLDPPAADSPSRGQSLGLSLKEDRIALEYVAIDKVANLFFLWFALQRNWLIRFNVRLWQVYLGIFWHCYTWRVPYSIALVNLAVAAPASAMTP